MSTTLNKEGVVTTVSPPVAETEETTTLDLRNPEFMASAYDTYARMRATGPTSKIEFGFGEPADEQERRRQEAFGRDAYLVIHYDEGVEALLDGRFSVDRMRAMTPEQRAEFEQATESDALLRPLSRNLLSIDPPDHTRLR